MLNFNINKFNYISEYALIGKLNSSFSIELEKDIYLNDLLNYQYINNKLIYNPIPYDTKPLGVNLVYTGSEWIDDSTNKEKQVFWKQKMIETNNKIKELYELGLNGGSEEQQLKLKLEEYKNNYFNALHEEALEINSKKGE